MGETRDLQELPFFTRVLIAVAIFHVLFEVMILWG